MGVEGVAWGVEKGVRWLERKGWGLTRLVLRLKEGRYPRGWVGTLWERPLRVCKVVVIVVTCQVGWDGTLWERPLRVQPNWLSELPFKATILVSVLVASKVSNVVGV